MRLRKNSDIKEPKARTASKSQGVKVSNYYTVSHRSDGKPEIDMSKRGTKRSTQSSTPSSGNHGARLLRLVLVIALVGIFIYTIRLSATPVVLVRNESSLGRTDVYQQGIREILSSSVLNRTKITVDRASVLEKIEEEFPELRSARMTTPFLGSRPVFHLDESSLLFSLEANGQSYLISDEGVVVGLASDYTLVATPIRIRDESGVEAVKGAKVLRSDDASFFMRIEELLRSKGRVLSGIRLTDTPREAYLNVKDVPYSLRVYLESDPDSQIASFFVAERVLGEGGQVPRTYMDLRAGEKIFWQ